MGNVVERIKLLQSLSGLSIRAYAQFISTNEQTLYKCINGRMPSVEMIQKILSTYPDISADWLLMGEGDIKKQKKEEMEEQMK